MRILAAIPHYFAQEVEGPGDGRQHASIGGAAANRVQALSACIASLHQSFGDRQRIIEIATLIARPANAKFANDVEVVVCTTQGRHLLDHLDLPAQLYRHRPTDAPPLKLGFECHAVLRDRIGEFDYYAYLEDDLIVRDPWMLAKLSWFCANVGDGALLQPNRFEVTAHGPALKAYLDGEIEHSLSEPFQDIRDFSFLQSTVAGVETAFRRSTNPHSGCFFLNARQMEDWAARPYFLDRDTSFIGPLESAASLGIMRTFRVYKPAPENASFLEIEHFGTGFISNLRQREGSDG